MTVFLWALLGYAAGTIPSTWIVARAMGADAVLVRVRRTVGETDAHVVLQQNGGRGGAIAAALDVVKAFLPVLLAVRVTGPHEVAACAIGAVVGHCWPPLLSRFAGRGLAAAAGVFLGFLPVEMVLAGLIRMGGAAVKAGGLASTVGFGSIPLLAWYRGSSAPHVLAAVVINGLILLRRLEGLGDDVDAGVPVGRAVFRRLVFDASAQTLR